MKALSLRFKASAASGCLTTLLCALVLAAPFAQAQEAAPRSTIVVDDFENGVGSWTRNDKIKTENASMGVVLVDLIATKPSPGGLPGSKGAALFTFKDAKNSWASASIKTNGAEWAKIGAQRLTFWLNADGAQQGTQLVLRGRYNSGSGMKEESFIVPVRLNARAWRRVSIPLAEIKNANGSLLSRLHNIYLLQFVQSGNWDSRFFAVDQLQVEGNGVPLAPPKSRPAPAPKPNPAPAAAPDSGNAIQVNIDFLKKQGRVRTGANISVGTIVPRDAEETRNPLLDNADFRRAVGTLRPRFVRLDAASLVELIDSLKPSFDYRRLAAAVRQVRAVGSEPLVAITNEPTWGLDERAYAAFCAGSARAINAGLSKPVTYFELPTGGSTSNDASAAAYYNRGRAAIKAINPNLKVGGIGASAGRTSSLNALLSRAQGLDFLSLQLYGTTAGTPSSELLFRSAYELPTLRSAARLLDKSRFSRAPIYVTQGNLNSARGDSPQLPSDGRTVEMISAAWWSTFLGNSSRLADQVFHNDAVNPDWGLLDENARAYPAYYAMWMWNTYFPSGSERVQAVSANPQVVAFAVNSPTAHNVLIANTTDAEVTVKVGIRGFPVLRAARLRILEDPQKGVRFEDLPKSPYQTITLSRYAMAVLQFTEPPKAAAKARR